MKSRLAEDANEDEEVDEEEEEEEDEEEEDMDEDDTPDAESPISIDALPSESLSGDVEDLSISADANCDVFVVTKGLRFNPKQLLRILHKFPPPFHKAVNEIRYQGQIYLLRWNKVYQELFPHLQVVAMTTAVIQGLGLEFQSRRKEKECVLMRVDQVADLNLFQMLRIF